MTLRARLTMAFLAIVLGPVLIGAVFVGTTVTRINQDRAGERLDVAANAVRTSIAAMCGQLYAVAQAVAAVPDEQRSAVASEFVARGLASGVHIDDGAGGQTTPSAPAPPWADCGAPDAARDAVVTGFEALSARVSYADGSRTVAAALTVDADLVRRLRAASGAEVTLLSGTGLPNPAPEPAGENVGLPPLADNADGTPAAATRDGAASPTREREGALAPAGGSGAAARGNDGAPAGASGAAGGSEGAPAPAGGSGAGAGSGAAGGSGGAGVAAAGSGAGAAGEDGGVMAALARAGLAGVAGGAGGGADAVAGNAGIGADRGASIAADRVGVPALHSTLEDAGAVAELAGELADGAAGRTAGGELVRRLGPVPGEPLPIALSLRADPPRETYLWLIMVVLATATAAVTAAWWLARTATSPLVGLAAAADRVAGGDLQTRVPARTNDEIGRLAQAFNHMTRELETYVNALTASRDQLRGHLGVLGDTLSSTHDIDRILEVILQTAKHATGAAGGIVLLADSAGELVGKCAEGMGIQADQIRVQVGQGLIGSVAATGVSRLGRVDRDGPRLDPAEPDCRTYVVVPFASYNDGSTASPALPPARGVLALYDRLGRASGCDDFDEQDLLTLRTFAGQAAVAVDNVRVHEEAQRLSVTDSLTGLFNYRSLRDTVRREADRAGRFGRKLSVLALDIDHFKEINDRFGHSAGDAVLAEFAQRIKYEIRDVDFAFRQGGEEFAILLPETDEVGGVAVAERLGDAVRGVPMPVHDGIAVPVTVSIGIAVLPDHGQSGAALLRAADEALYAAKTAGRDTFRVAGDALCAIGNTSGGASGAPQPPRQTQGR